MKKNHILIVALMVMFISSCSKDDKEHLAPHDGNKIMSQMHDMMSKMMAMQMTKDPEVDFLRMMVMHHQGAINMAKIDLSEGQNDSLKLIAQKIITEQQAEIIKFNNYLSSLTVNNSVPAFNMQQMENMSKMGKLADVQFITNNIDNDFASLMIPHHQSAIDNAQAYLKYGNDSQITIWAQNIIDTQKMEIIELSNWLIIHKR